MSTKTNNATGHRDDATETSQLLREASFDTTKPIDIDVALMTGRIDITLVDQPGVHVEVSNAPYSENHWLSGLTNVMSWVNEQLGSPSPESVAEAIQRTRIDFTGRRLVVRAPKSMPFAGVGLAVRIRAPQGSHVQVKAGAATIALHGKAGSVRTNSGAGKVEVENATGTVAINSGAATIRLGTMTGGVRVKNGAGDIDLAALDSMTGSLVSGSGDIRVGTVTTNLVVRTGSGDITVSDGIRGRLELGTGFGDLAIAIHQGTRAALDVVSHSGQVQSDLATSQAPSDSTTPTLFVRARTGSGNAAITRAGS